MKRTLRPQVEPLEGKSLLSGGFHIAHHAISTPVKPAPSGGLVLTLTTNRSVYRQGQPVVLTLKETNTTNHSLVLIVGPSLNGLYVNQNGNTVWRSNGGLQPALASPQIIPPHKSIKFTATWHGDSNTDVFSGPKPLANPTGAFQASSQSALYGVLVSKTGDVSLSAPMRATAKPVTFHVIPK